RRPRRAWGGGPLSTAAQWKRKRETFCRALWRLSPLEIARWLQLSALASSRWEASNWKSHLVSRCASLSSSRHDRTRYERTLRTPAAQPRTPSPRLADRAPLCIARHNSRVASRDPVRHSSSAVRHSPPPPHGGRTGNLRRRLPWTSAQLRWRVGDALCRDRRDAAGCRPSNRTVRLPDRRHDARERGNSCDSQHEGFPVLRNRY